MTDLKDNTRKAKIIFDVPATDDAFNSGGHKRSGTALAEAINQLANRDGAIGLEGEWGSGKTTVVNLAKGVLDKQVNNSYAYKMFFFDLWEHQTDDFRRSFLEEFIAWLGKGDLLNNKEIKHYLDKIRNREKTVTTYNFKRYNFLGGLVLFLSPLIPLLYMWLSPMVLKPNEDGVTTLTLPTSLAILSIEFLYIALVTKIALLVVAKQPIDEHRKNFLDKCGAAISSSLSLFSKDVQKEEQKQSIRESDPTTIEFHSIFREILSKVQSDKKRLVFILDNIDRLPSKSVSEVWSEVRSLFSNVSFNNKTDQHAWATVVVPYDRTYIKSAFGDIAKTTDRQGTSSETDIFAKTFNIILHVSPPVVTDWKAFLAKQLNSAFKPEFEKEVFAKIFAILNYHFELKGTNPTPRFIISFVNELIALWMQWDTLIPLEVMALYILNKPTNANDIRNIEQVKERYLNVAQIKDWQRDFAALFFNVPPEVANQVLLRQPIIRALSLEDSLELTKLSAAGGFQEVFQSALEETLVNVGIGDSKSLSKVAKNLSNLTFEGATEAAVWAAMGSQLGNLEKIDVEKAEAYEGLLLAVSKQRDENVVSLASRIKEVINQSLPDTLSEYELAAGWCELVAGLGASIKNVVGIEGRKTFLKTVQIPNNPTFSKNVAYKCCDDLELKYSELHMTCKADDMLNNFDSDDIAPTNMPPWYLKVISQVDYLFDTSARNKHIDLIAGYLRAKQITEVSDLGSIFECLVKLYAVSKGRGSTKPTIVSLANEGTLSWYGAIASKAQNANTEAIIEWLIIDSMAQKMPSLPIPEPHPSLGSLNAVRNWHTENLSTVAPSEETLIKLALLVSLHSSFTTWLDYALNDSSPNKLFALTFKRVLEQKKYNNLDVGDVISKYSKIKALYGDEVGIELLENLSRWEPHFSSITLTAMPSDFVIDIEKIKKRENYDGLIERIDTFLKDSTQDEWDLSFEMADDRLRLLIARQTADSVSLPPDRYRPALRAHMRKMLEGRSTPQISAEEWVKVLSALKENNRIVLGREILNELPTISLSAEGCERWSKYYEMILEKIPFETSPDVSLEKVFTYWITSNDNDVRALVDKHRQAIEKCFKASGDVSQKGFEEIIEGMEERAISDQDKLWSEKVRLIVGLPEKKARQDKDVKTGQPDS